MRIKQYILLILLWNACTAAYGGGLAAAGPHPAAGSKAAAQAKPGAPHFAIWEFRVAGNTLLDRQAVERAVYPFLGPDKTLADIEHARKALEQRYHKAGYATVLVDIPQQSIENGVVHLRVTEGKVDRVLVTGSQYFSLQRIRDEVPSLAAGTVPYFPAVQAQLAALDNVTPDRTITPVLRPGRTPGTVEVELKVKDELPLHGNIQLDDYNSVDTTSLRLNGMLRYDNMWQKEHSLSIQYQTSPEDTSQVQVWSSTYLARTPFSDNILAFYGVHSDSNIAALGALAVVGKGDILGVRLIMPLAGTDTYFHHLTFGVAYQNFKQNVVLVGADSVKTPIEYVPFLVQYDGTRRAAGSVTNFGIGVHFGVRGLVNRSSQFETKRHGAQADYLYLRANADHQQELYGGMRLRVSIDGQITDSPLISNEEFSAGGPGSVRGYHISEAFGDDAIQGTVELYSPPLVWGVWTSRIQNFRALVFWDGAELRVRNPSAGTPGNYVLSSAGVGLRLQAWPGVTASLDAAQIFHRTETLPKDEKRVVFDIEYTF